MKRILYLSIVLLVLLSGCKMQRGVVKDNTEQARLRSELRLTEQIMQSAPAVESLQANKVRLQINYGGQQLSANGSLHIVRDSAIVVSVQPLLGLELYRLEMDRQEVRLIDKMNKRYCRLSYKEVMQQTGLGIEYEDIEAALLQRLFVAGQADTEYLKDIRTIEEGEHYIAGFTEGRLTYRGMIDKNSLRLTENIIGMAEKGDFTTLRYSDMMQIGEVSFPMSIGIAYESAEMSAIAELQLQKVKLNEGADVKMLSVERYSSITIDKLLR